MRRLSQTQIRTCKTGKFFLRDKAQESEQLTLYQIADEYPENWPETESGDEGETS